MPKKLSLEEVQYKINKVCNYVLVKSKLGPGKYEFEDIEFGIFYGYLNHLISGKLVHERRKKNLRNVSLNERKLRIKEKFPHLELLVFNQSLKSLFYDECFGEFYANFKDVYSGKQKHPERTRLLKKQSRNKKEVRDKIKQTNLERYGVENPTQNKDVYNKVKKTNLKRYGYNNVSQNKEIQQKRTETNLKRFDCENVFQNDFIKEKIKQTIIENYNVENIAQLNVIKNKISKTNIKKYGFKSPAQNEEIKDKIKQTNLENGNWHNINGYSLVEYYRKSILSDKRSYSHVQHCYDKDGNEALELEYYDQLYGKSRVSNKWLDQIEKELGYSLIKEYHILGTRYHADGYDPKTNTIYEFYGDYWHGYPFKYLGINKTLDLSFNTLFYRTMDRKEKILELGYNVIDIWENDFNKAYIL